MPIKIAVNRITSEEIKEILNYYNSHKQIDDANLEYLNCNEGGFKLTLPIKEYVKKYTRNGFQIIHSKQMRWHFNLLVAYYNHPSFNKNEEELLYISMQRVLGRENVKWYDSYSSAITKSPSFYLDEGSIDNNNILKQSPLQRKSPSIQKSPSQYKLEQNDIVYSNWGLTRARI